MSEEQSSTHGEDQEDAEDLLVAEFRLLRDEISQAMAAAEANNDGQDVCNSSKDAGVTNNDDMEMPETSPSSLTMRGYPRRPKRTFPNEIQL